MDMSLKSKSTLPETLDVSLNSGGPSGKSVIAQINSSHILQNTEKNYNTHQLDLSMQMLRNREGLHAPIKLSMEMLAAKKIVRHPFLQSSNAQLDSNADNVRSIPCSVDGLKPGQRKVLYTCFLRNDKKEVKVAQLAGYIAGMSAYDHGEVSLCGTIVNLAQNYVGSNNINLLEPRGQFGTRLAGGKDSASPRYIYTKMSPLTRLIFHPQDEPLLTFQIEDNQKIEPICYIPIIPMILVNGAEGIGTGWSTKIPNYNPRDLIRQIRRMLSNKEPDIIHPWYKNFCGTVEYISDNRYLTTGKVDILGDNKIEITELPIGTWTETYIENVLEPLLYGSEKVKSIINDYQVNHTDTTVSFVVTFARGEFDRIQSEDGGFHRVFKLTTSINTGQMHAFDHLGTLHRYESATHILKEYFPLRLEYYGKRKIYLEGKLQAEVDHLTEKTRFILDICNGTIVVENKKHKVTIDELVKLGYRPDPVTEWKHHIKINNKEEEEEQEQEEDYEYLLSLSMLHLTYEKQQELIKIRNDKLLSLQTLKLKTPQILWEEDLAALEDKLNLVEGLN